MNVSAGCKFSSAVTGIGVLVSLFCDLNQAGAQTDVEELPAAVNRVDESTAETETLIIDKAQTSLIKNAFIAAPMSGVVAAVNVTEGDLVAADAPLVRMQSDLAEKELVAAKAALDAARLESDNDVNLRYAKRTLEVRDHTLRQSRLANETYAGVVSEMDLEEIRLTVDQAALAIEQAHHDLMIAEAAAVEKEAAVAIAQTKLNRHTVRTGVTGMVAEIAVETGEWVEAGKPMVRIISLDPIRVECFVDGRRYGSDLVGRNVKFIPTGAAESASLHGTVTFVSRELHPVTGQVRLWATLANPQGKIGAGASGRLICP